MGLFDRFLKKPEGQPFSYLPGEHEAWIGILMACMTADGDMDALEIDALARMLSLKDKFRGVDIGPHLSSVMNAKGKLGGIGLVEACSNAIKAEDKDTLFAMSVELVLADGSIDSDEEMVIDAIAKAMNVKSDTAEKIVEVMLIRTKGNLVL